LKSQAGVDIIDDDTHTKAQVVIIESNIAEAMEELQSIKCDFI
jgi:hypothetical protein